MVNLEGRVGNRGNECSAKSSITRGYGERPFLVHGGLFKYLTTPKENAEPLLRRWLLALSI